MSNLSELLPTGGGQNAVDFVASGTLSSGQTVALKSDGTVEAVTATTLSAVDNAGTPSTFVATGECFYISSTYDAASQKIVVAFQDRTTPNYGTAVVGTVSGTSISFGTPVVFESASTLFTSCTYDSNNQKIVIAYRDGGNSDYGTAIVGTVSGTSISFGTPVVFNSGGQTTIYPRGAVYHSSAGKVVISYSDGGNSYSATSIVGTVSGNSISFGSSVAFDSSSTDIYSTFDSSNEKIVVTYRDNYNSNYGTAIVGTVSGTSISFGSSVVFESANTLYPSVVYDSANQKIVIAYRDNGNSDYGTAIVGTVSGTSISFGTPVIFQSSFSYYMSATYDENAQKVAVFYNGSSVGTVIVGTVSGTSISFNSPTVFETGSVSYV